MWNRNVIWRHSVMWSQNVMWNHNVMWSHNVMQGQNVRLLFRVTPIFLTIFNTEMVVSARSTLQ